jgi:hypothetical protein
MLLVIISIDERKIERHTIEGKRFPHNAFTRPPPCTPRLAAPFTTRILFLFVNSIVLIVNLLDHVR